MKIALLLGAKPRTPLHGPTVVLRPGNWHVEVEGHIDSTIRFYLNDVLIALNELFQVTEPTRTRIVIETAGTEKYLSAYAVHNA